MKFSEPHSQPYFITPLQSNLGYPLFIFLPGLGETTQINRLQTAGLETAFNVRCLMLPPQELSSWEVLAQKVVDLTQTELAAEQASSIYLCGECFGACLAFKVLLQAPQLFNRIILINPASSFNRLPWNQWVSFFTNQLPQPVYQLFSTAFLPFLTSLKRTTPANREALLQSVKSAPLEASAHRLSLLSGFSIDKQQLQQLSQPFLIITSKADLILPSFTEAQRLVRKLPNARMITLPNSGHTCLLEEETNLFEILKAENFIDSVHC